MTKLTQTPFTNIAELVLIPKRRNALRSRVSESKKAFANELRRNPTTAAAVLWSILRRKRLGYKFRRRAVLYGWIPDFWCPECRVAIEIDYPSDQQRAGEHKRRDAILAARAITVIRVPAVRIYSELCQVECELKSFLVSQS